ncbi:ligand-binding sensor domain-containing diguanylate cyclase [Thermomonas sp. HDW16]|uniref:ligand-binding sensor domain-containing diguanylate cyclase n=1 Tax=Thermomonas sp. HDW16 TaxID=2714945 RepID=UPI00140C8347|nr:ligand-binding sensor domain-containing diguanylate cyclase [Thermomonas sp. HDW16]QIL20620.1 diguanylate cyclase [Thermomonas sp. HDW16]
MGRRQGISAGALVAALLLLFACLWPGFVHAQDKPLSAYFRETWTTRQGLPHNQVNAIAQTPDGYLWFGTWEGLVRYNGLEFHSFDRSNTPALKDNGIRSVRASPDGAVVIGTSRGGVTVKRGDLWRTWMVKDGLAQEEIMDALLDRKGRLWVATESSGIDLVDGDKITHITSRDGLPSGVTYGLLLDRDDSVWVATARGLVHFVDGRKVMYAHAAGLPNAPVFRIFQDPAGRIFVGTERGVYRREKDRFVQVSPLLPDDGVPSLAQDAAGNLWVGTVNNGLLRLGKSGVEKFTSLRGLPNNRVAALLVDREGSLWGGTNAGLLRLSDAPFSTYNGDQGLSDDYVRALAQSRDGSLWIGTSRGLNRWRGNKLEASYTAADGLPSDSVLSLLEDRDGSLLVGSYTAGVLRLRDGKLVAQYDNAHGMPGSNQVRALVQEPDGTLWIGTTRGLVRMRAGKFEFFGVAKGLPREFIISLHLARDGSLWVGTANGAARIVGERVQALDMRGMNGAQDVFDFHEDADGTLWFATDRGLLRYRQGQLRALGLAKGLPIDTLFAVVDDGVGSFWLTSNRGVMRVSRSEAEAVIDGRKAKLELDRFGEADGLASNQCNGGSGPAALRDRNGRIWVATAGGAAVVNPKSLHAYKRRLPPVVIEQALANDQVVSLQGALKLPAGTHKLEFHYASLSFQTPRFVRYRYRLEGVDRGWIERGNQRVAQYTNLMPGNYRFAVNASAPGLGQGWSSDITTLDIEIKPRFWQHAWFLPALTLLGVLLVVGLYRWRLGHMRQRALNLEAIVEERTSDLRDQTERLRESDREKSSLVAKLKEQSEAFERQAREDSLTGLGNRRSMDEELARTFEQAATNGKSLSFALVDIDHFKRINDGYSHAAGDRALIEVARLMREELGALGKLARWGGEEFAILFEGLALEEARRRCERLRWAIERLDCSGFAPGWKMSISGGVAERTGLAHYERLVSRADALLYEAKRAGRNRIMG